MEQNEYKWHLRKGSRKEICPCCGHKRFVPYVDAAGNPAGEEYGRCDREQSCGYIKYPNGVETDAKPQPIKILQPIRFSPAVVQTNPSGNLFDYACKWIGEDAARRAWERYRVGAYGNSAIFWQIDKCNQVHAGKMMEYGADGHRVKNDDRATIKWCHKLRYYDHTYTGEELQQCFFGEHLLTEYPEMNVCIVESEKTAVMMSELDKSSIYLACGGSCGLKNAKRNEALKGRKVSLSPDNGKYWEWRAIAQENGWHCEWWCDMQPIFYGLSDGYDILDVFESNREQ